MRRGMTGGSLSGWLAFLGPLAAYGITLSPGIDFWDTGEMQTVPYLPGVAHPTGFPLFVLAAGLFGRVVAFGDPAWRISLFSAVASAGAAWLAFRFTTDRTRDPLVGLAAALAFAAGDVVWTRAVRAEVHDLALFFIALALTLAARAGDARESRALAAPAAALGCALATHPVALLALPCATAFAWPALRAASLPTLLRALGMGALPLLAYAYVPLRSAYVEAHGLDPAAALGLRGGAFFDSDAPSTPAAFVRYLTGANFHAGGAFAAALTPNGLARAFAFARDVAGGEYTLATLLLVGAGLVAFATSQPRVAVGIATLVACVAAFVGNYPAESDSARYALPVFWAFATCAAVGALRICTAIAGRASPLATAFAALALAIAASRSSVAAYADVRAATAREDARALAPLVAAHTVDGSLVVASWAFATPIAYAAYVVHAFGARRLVCGWPSDVGADLSAWRARFGHVYVVVPLSYDVRAIANRRYVADRWQLAEIR
jgi:hypothetical protein